MIKGTSLLLILENIPVNCLMTYRGFIVLFKPSADLFRAPVPFQIFLNIGFDCLGKANMPVGIFSPFQSLLISLLWTISFEYGVSLDLASDRGFIDSDKFSDPALR